MKKLITLFFVGASFFSFSQVNVTYQVDITEYLAAGNTLDPNGIRVGGDFTTQGATVADWTPADPSAALTDMGSNIWSLTVEYPMSSVGNTQSYKFVNGDWGMNEGTDPATTIAIDGCGIDDGSGNINRQLVIPDSDVTYTFCWDSCFQCNGDAPTASLGDQIFNGLKVTPNPSVDFVNFDFGDVLGDVSIRIYDLSGKLVSAAETSVGTAEVNVSDLQSGSYIYTLTTTSGASTSGKMMKL
ncbi:MAG: T9SS type A sorting domain-containing protein [Crocinitomicaceae bacterium]